MDPIKSRKAPPHKLGTTPVAQPGQTQEGTKQIPLFRPLIREKTIEAVGEVLRSGWLGLGPKSKQFEQEFAAYVGAPHCIGLNSCTSALHLALRILDLPPGTEVITTALTFVSTNHVILYENCQPVFADVNPTTGNISVDSVASKITPKTGAIIIVHYGGYPCDIDALYALARQHNLPIIEDCAHACGASYKGKKIGSHGDIHAFSFHAVKNLAMGDGGALTVHKPEYNDRLRRLRWFGIDADTFQRNKKRGYHWDYEVTELGFKYHINDIHAVIGLHQLAHLEADNLRRANIAEQYTEGLKDIPGLQLLNYQSDRKSSYHIFCALAEKRDGLIQKLKSSGIHTGVHYRRNDSYPMFESQHLPNTEYFWSHAISLPMHLLMTDEDVQYIIQSIQSGW